jgi:alanine racemase
MHSIVKIVKGKLFLSLQTLNQGKKVSFYRFPPLGRQGEICILIDSRKLTSPEKTLFVAIKGERNNGHEYIEELYHKGVRNFVISESLPSFKKSCPEANFIIVKNSLKALQELAAHHRNQFNLPVVAITGSNGKTMVKEWLFQLLHENKAIVRSPKSYNSQVGVPLSVWQIRKQHKLALFEAGISKPGEMQRLEAILKPDIGIITNIGQAHHENFLEIEQKAKEKLILFKQCKQLLYCKDYEIIHRLIGKNVSLSKLKLYNWSRHTKSNLQIKNIETKKEFSHIRGIYKNKFIEITIPFSDQASIDNAISCWLFMLVEGYEQEKIQRGMSHLQPLSMRLELKEGINDCTIINDGYNSDIESLSIALDFLNQQKQQSKKTIILSDILQSGKDRKELYKEISQIVKQKGVHQIIGIGKEIAKEKDQFNINQKIFYNSTDEFLTKHQIHSFSNEVILLKGSRLFQFENISHALQKKSHETVLEINLNALVDNLNYFRSQLKAQTKVMAMVKAFSYGSGSFEIANVLQFQKVDYLAVAYADEGIELRKAGITLPIMVMSPEENSFENMLFYKLEPEIYNFKVLRELADSINRFTFNKSSLYDNSSFQHCLIHIKIDSGMHRLGFEHKNIETLIAKIKAYPYLKIQSVFSHLAASDDNKHNSFTLSQTRKFEEISLQISQSFNYPIMRHILNSEGVIRHNKLQYDMVRLGIGLYGISSGSHQSHLENAGSLKTLISQIKTISKNETIGYNRRELVKKEMTIATIPIGYADGLNRKLGNRRGYVYIKNHKAPIIGDICMDMCMIDISNIHCEEGDEVIIFNSHQHIKDLAKNSDTIPYEILTGISGRVKRVYYQE